MNKPTLAHFKRIFSRYKKDSIEQLAAFCGLNESTVRNIAHLKTKEAQRQAERLGYTYVPVASENESEDETRRARVIKWLKEREGSNRYDIAKMLGVNYETAERTLSSMQHDGIVFKSGFGAQARYSLKRGNDLYNISYVHGLFAKHFE